MASCFFIAWFGIAVVVLGGFSGVFWWLGVDHVTATGEDTREGKIQTYCASIASWESKGTYLDGFRYQLQNSAGVGVNCSVVSTPTEKEGEASEMSDGQCGNYAIKKIVCGNLNTLISSPSMGSSYELRLFTSLASDDSMVEKILVGSVNLKAALEKRELVPLPSTSSTCKAECKKNEAKELCENAPGIWHDGDCQILFRLAGARTVIEPCFVLAPSSSASSGGFGLSSGMWPEDVAIDTQAGFRCIRPVRTWNVEPDMRNYLPDATLSSSASLEALVSDSAVTFRHADDPFVVASSLSDSNFELGLSKGAKIAMGIGFIIAATCFSCCFIGAVGGLCRMGFGISKSNVVRSLE